MRRLNRTLGNNPIRLLPLDSFITRIIIRIPIPTHILTTLVITVSTAPTLISAVGGDEGPCQRRSEEHGPIAQTIMTVFSSTPMPLTSIRTLSSG